MTAPFIAYDGRGSEVKIISGEGKIIEAQEKNNVTQFSVQDENPKVERPNSGWINNSDPLLQDLLKAKEENRIIKYRIEIQRRDGVDINTPIQELMGKQDLAKAYKNTIKIFAGMDGKLSAEAVTDPAQDSVGRVSALNKDIPQTSNVSPSNSYTLDDLNKMRSYISHSQTLETLAFLSGDNIENVEEFLQRLNKAEYASVTASVVNDLSQKDFPVENIETVVSGILWVADSVQTSLFKLSKANRLNDSHKQIRMLVMSEVTARTIKGFETKDMNTYKTVGVTVLERYSTVLSVISKPLPTKYMDLSDISSPTQTSNNVDELSEVKNNDMKTDGHVFDFPAQNIEEVKAQSNSQPASDENIEAILTLASKIEQPDYPKLSKYLQAKFGVTSFAQIPDVYLSEIISFFNSAGTPDESAELFKQAVLNI